MNSRLYKILLVMLTVVLLGASGLFQRALDRQRQDPRMGIVDNVILSNAPPLLAFTTVALGSFRGLIANTLWMRAMKLQDEAKFFEMVQLSDWITKLQPQIPAVWINQAWNMTYNISVRFSQPIDRWRWVRRGIALLRDEGLRYNPRNAEVYRELGWFYQHKLGYFLDESHNEYRAAHYGEMNALLGPAATNTMLLINPSTEEDRQRAENFRNVTKMDPGVMREVEMRYGVQEWRLPETHAIYWGYLGLKNCAQNPANRETLIGLRRLIYQSLHGIVLRGRIVQFTQDGRPEIVPNFDLIPAAQKGYEEMIAEEKTERRFSILTAHKNFIREVVYLLYINGRPQEADQWFKMLLERYPEGAEGETTTEAYSMKRLRQNVADGSLQRTRPLIIGLLSQEIVAEAQNLDEDALNYAVLAKRIYDDYQGRFGHTDRVRLQSWESLRTEALRQMLHPTTGLVTNMASRVMKRRNITSLTNLFAAPANVPGADFMDSRTNEVDSLKIPAIKPPGKP